MVDDPVWQAKHFDPDFTSDPNYFIYGGWCLSSAHPFVVDQNILLLPTLRLYPKVGSTNLHCFFHQIQFGIRPLLDRWTMEKHG